MKRGGHQSRASGTNTHRSEAPAKNGHNVPEPRPRGILLIVSLKMKIRMNRKSLCLDHDR